MERTTIRGRYRLDEAIGRGAQAETFRATDVESSRRVIVKRLALRRAREWKAVELFEREARILERVVHPGVPKLLDFFHEGGSTFYLVQEEIDGENLEDLDCPPLSEHEAIDLARDVLQVLIHLHRQNPAIIHRDLKPSNVIRRPDGSIVLVDFGAAQTLSSLHATGGSTIAGTFGYMPPEQLVGRAEPSSDLYALGGTLVFMLSRRHPCDLEHDRMRLVFRPHVQISERFARFLEALLEPAIEDRFESSETALRALDTLASRKRSERRLVRRNLERTLTSSSTSIRVRAHGESVVAEIPPFLHGRAYWEAGLGAFFVIAGVLLAQISPAWALFAAPVVLYAAYHLLRPMCGAHLRIGPRRFTLRKELLGIPYWVSMGPTKSMWIEEELDAHGDVMSSLSIWSGGERELRLVGGIGALEREWLLDTLRARLKAVRDHELVVRTRPKEARIRLNLLPIRTVRRC